jgi:uncharacterized SAM-binding protein YcdF (DUF218 family)
MFLFKKLVAPLFFPLPFCLLLLAIGLALLWFSRRQKAGRIVATSAFAILVVLSYGWFSNPLLQSLERVYPPPGEAEIARAKWVVVLGGGTFSDPSLPITSRATGTTLARLVEGIRLHRQSPGSRLILSGSAAFGLDSDAQSMQAIALSLGVAPERIVLDDASPDTESQAVNIARIVKDEPCLIVTSGFHLRRSLGLFADAGVKATPAPTHYIVQTNRGASPSDLYPGAHGLVTAQIVENEYLGIAWSWLRGRI